MRGPSHRQAWRLPHAQPGRALPSPAAPQTVLQKGKLNPHNLKLFLDTEYPWLLKQVKVRGLLPPAAACCRLLPAAAAPDQPPAACRLGTPSAHRQPARRPGGTA
jgi:hypothetical protein